MIACIAVVFCSFVQMPINITDVTSSGECGKTSSYIQLTSSSADADNLTLAHFRLSFSLKVSEGEVPVSGYLGPCILKIAASILFVL